MTDSDSRAGLSRDRWIGLSLLAVTILAWGLNLPAIKYIILHRPPLFLRGTSCLVGGACLAVVALSAGESLRVPRELWGRLLFAGFVNVFAWLGLPALALRWLTIGENGSLVFTMPIWTMLLSWIVQGARPTLRNILALLLGLCGIGVLFASPDIGFGGDKIIGALLALTAAVSFALGVVATPKALPLPPIMLVAWQLALGAIPMMVAGLLFERPDWSGMNVIEMAGLAYVILVGTALAYITWFAALKRLPATTASIGTLMVPVVGVIGGALLLGQPVSLREVLALGFTLAGAGLSLRRA